MKPVTPIFFCRDTAIVAQELLGKIIQVGTTKARIVETEAYGDDSASHAYTKTPRSALMFDTYGHVYVYLIYGMYECLNFTTEKEGIPGAVLIRAVEPLSKIPLMKRRRKTGNIFNLCSGPGKLCQALAITRQHNGGKIGHSIKVLDDSYLPAAISHSSRIGIKDALDLPWRFYIEGNAYVSKANIKLNK